MRDTLLVSDKQFHDIAWTKRFWSDYYWQTPCIDGEYQELAFKPLEFALSDAVSLTLHTDAQLSQVTLGLLHPSFECVQTLGWDNTTHWQPYALRWCEFENLLEFFSRSDAAIEADLPLLLLYRFAPVLRGNDAEARLNRIEKAWRRLGVFSNAEIKHLMAFADRREAPMEWSEDEKGNWVLKGYAAYSQRTPENLDFPHCEFNALMRLTG